MSEKITKPLYGKFDEVVDALVQERPTPEDEAGILQKKTGRGYGNKKRGQTSELEAPRPRTIGCTEASGSFPDGFHRTVLLERGILLVDVCNEGSHHIEFGQSSGWIAHVFSDGKQKPAE